MNNLPLSRERRVLLRKGQTGFGFNIVGGDGEEGIHQSWGEQNERIVIL